MPAIVNRLWTSLTQGRRVLYPFEVQILEGVKALLSPRSAIRLQAQVDGVNKVQRLCAGKEVNLYRMVGGRPGFEPELRFANCEAEAHFATTRLSGGGREASLRVDLWLAGGQLFSMTYSASPNQFFSGCSLEEVEPVISSTALWLDPEEEQRVSGDCEVANHGADVSRWFGGDSSRLGEVQAHPPLPAARQQALLSLLDATLPSDFLDLLQRCDGVSAECCHVHGLAQIRIVAEEERNWYLLAERDNVVGLAVKDGSRDGEIYRICFETGEALRVGTSFGAALQSLL